jgi:hypothetical protein
MRQDVLFDVIRSHLNNKVIKQYALPGTVMRQFLDNPDKKLTVDTLLKIAIGLGVDLDISFVSKEGSELTEQDIEREFKKLGTSIKKKSKSSIANTEALLAGITSVSEETPPQKQRQSDEIVAPSPVAEQQDTGITNVRLTLDNDIFA